MNTWYQFSDEERRQMLDIAYHNGSQKQRGLSQAIVEKDWWVTMVLNALFKSSVRDYLSFKGGTSLSKGWGLIERFSEDIDMAIDHSFYGIENTNKSQREKLRKVGRKYIVEHLAGELEGLLHEAGLMDCKVVPVVERQKSGETILIDSDKDPVVLHIQYRSVVPNLENYMLPYVKVEISNLSMSYPTDLRVMRSLLFESFGEEDMDTRAEARTVLPTRTFLEKIFLLAEEFQKVHPRHLRMSRHLYDLERLMDTEYGKSALVDDALYNAIVEHRRTYYALKYVNYDLHARQTIRFVPPVEVQDAWRRDYEDMKTFFIYGDALDFDKLMQRIQDLQNKIRG